MQVLVTGCPRSGTTFVSRALQRKGWDVRHEAIGKHGSVSYLLAVDDAEYPFAHAGERRADFAPDLIVHLVREPLATIGSLSTMMRELGPFFARHVGPLDDEDPMRQAGLVWLRWNRRIEPQADFRLRVEDVTPAGLGTTTNGREHSRPTFGALGEYALAVREQAREYGYAYDDRGRCTTVARWRGGG